jgi:competence protein ComGC
VAATSAATRLREESGWTLIELLVSSALLIVILSAILALLDTANKVVPQDQERAADIREAQVGLYQMTREMRQAYSLVQSSPYLLEAHVYESGADHDVVYDCTGNSSAGPTLGQCVRYESSGGVGGPRTVVIDRLLNKSGSGLPPVFAYTQTGGKTTYASAHVEVPAKGARKVGYRYRIVLQDGMYFRNLNLG